MKDSIKTIILVIALLAIGYFLLPYVKINKNTQSQNQSSDTSKNPPTSGVQTYNSDKLGLTFKYNPDQDADGKADTAVKETEDKLYVYFTASPAEQGQWVQKFTKDPNVTLVDAVKKQFLTDVPQANCFAKDLVEFYSQYGAEVPSAPDNITRALIAYPFPTDTTQPFNQNASKCPATYSLSNGLSYFLMDKNHPDKYYFFSIGQYAILADKEVAWQDTVSVK